MSLIGDGRNHQATAASHAMILRELRGEGPQYQREWFMRQPHLFLKRTHLLANLLEKPDALMRRGCKHVGDVPIHTLSDRIPECLNTGDFYPEDYNVDLPGVVSRFSGLLDYERDGTLYLKYEYREIIPEEHRNTPQCPAEYMHCYAYIKVAPEVRVFPSSGYMEGILDRATTRFGVCVTTPPGAARTLPKVISILEPGRTLMACSAYARDATASSLQGCVELSRVADVHECAEQTTPLDPFGIIGVVCREAGRSRRGTRVRDAGASTSESTHLRSTERSLAVGLRPFVSGAPINGFDDNG